MSSTSPAPMRVAVISEHASPLALLGGVDSGGQNIYVAQMARALARAGHTVDVFTRRDNRALEPVVDMAPRVRVFHVPAGKPAFVPKEALLPLMPQFLRGCERVCRQAAYDVVHANFFMSGWVAMQLKQRLGLPFAVTPHALGLVRRVHQQQADGFSPRRPEIEREVIAQADTVIAECPQDESDLKSLYGADARRIAMVPCGFDAAEMQPMDRAVARRELGLPDHEFIVLQLGRLVPRKGVDNVIRALAHLPDRVPTRLLVVGGEADCADEAATPEIGRLRAVARECGVLPRVSFTGRRQRELLHLYYAASNVFVSTPWYEPFGITPLEAMACARPVIGSAVGGIQYSVVDGVTGLLVPPKDPQALAQALLELYDKPLHADAMGQAGLRRVRESFTWDRVGHALAQALDAVRLHRPIHGTRPNRRTGAPTAAQPRALVPIGP